MAGKDDLPPASTEANDADLLEQRMADRSDGIPPSPRDPERPEADALEQQRVVQEDRGGLVPDAERIEPADEDYGHQV